MCLLKVTTLVLSSRFALASLCFGFVCFFQIDFCLLSLLKSIAVYRQQHSLARFASMFFTVKHKPTQNCTVDTGQYERGIRRDVHLSEFFDCDAAQNWKESFFQLRCVIASCPHGELRLQNCNLHLNRIEWTH